MMRGAFGNYRTVVADLGEGDRNAAAANNSWKETDSLAGKSNQEPSRELFNLIAVSHRESVMVRRNTEKIECLRSGD